MAKTKTETADSTAALRIGEEIERAKHRCRLVIDQITSLPPKTSHSPAFCYNQTLLRLAQSELSFLSRFSNLNRSPNPLSCNIGHLEAVVHILRQPFVNGVSRVCKPIAPSPPVKFGNETKISSVHVDIACTVSGNPVWFLVSARNPKYITWNGSRKSKSLRTRIQQVVDAAAQSSLTTKPCSIILFFSSGVDDSIRGKLEDEFGASDFNLEFSDFDFEFCEELEDEWVFVDGRSYRSACAIEIKIDHSGNAIPKVGCGVKDSLLGTVSPRETLLDECSALNLGTSFCRLVSIMKLQPFGLTEAELARENDVLGEADLINFDTTALIALISGISNGSTEKLLATSENKLRQRFKSNFEFVIAQVLSEIEDPIHVELEGVLSGKRGMICDSVRLEFKELVSMCGGQNERSRADHLLKCLMIVPDSPSARMTSLPTTRKLALKNMVVFGTGDFWRAPTLTANRAFVRAVSQTGMSLFTIEHRPRALTGD